MTQATRLDVSNWVNPFDLFIRPLTTWNFWIKFIAVIISTLIIFSVVTKFDLNVLIAIAILSWFAIFMIDNATGTNIVGSLPSATYPNPPHLGLDGVGLANRMAGTSI